LRALVKLGTNPSPDPEYEEYKAALTAFLELITVYGQILLGQTETDVSEMIRRYGGFRWPWQQRN
jgi:hypothetical protein